MDYDLAKQLKEAGFIQPELPEYRREHDKGGYLFEKLPPRNAFYSENDFGEMAYAPSLSELIKACGGSFWKLENYNHHEYEWFAYTPQPDERTYKGKTPEEAVANLWISLQN